MPYINIDTTHTFQTFSILVPPKIREKLLIYLNLKGIGASVHFTPALHQQRLFKKYKKRHVKLENAEFISARTVSLPIYPDMKLREVDAVCARLKNFFV